MVVRHRQTNKLPPALKYGVYSGMTLLPGEDLTTYDDFLGRVYAAVKPVDIIDEIFIDDVACLEWEVLRWRRLKSSLMRACALKALQEFLREHLEYDQYWKFFEEDLTEILQENLADQTEDDAQTLAHKCARNDPDANDKVNRILTGINLDMNNDVVASARARKAEELAQEYLRHKPGAIKLVDKLLAKAGLSIDAPMAEALSGELDDIERIDRLITIAETRRNAMLREIDRRRAVLGQTLRQHMQEVEGDFKVVEKTPPDAKGGP